MRTYLTVCTSFEAGHTVPTDPLCDAPGHGHRWKVHVTYDGSPDHGDFLSALQSIVDEIAGRNLNDMLPGVVTSPVGLGLYVRERLALDWPKVLRIQVDMGPSISSTIEWEIR